MLITESPNAFAIEIRNMFFVDLTCIHRKAEGPEYLGCNPKGWEGHGADDSR
jgi:hypothetical protein